MGSRRKIVVEVIVPAPVQLVWERSQEPQQHTLWDIRFDDIRYLEEHDQKGFQQLDYRTSIGFGIIVQGFGRYLHSEPLKLSTFEFDSRDWKSLITRGRGIWAYEPCSAGTRFKTVYDYDVRHGLFGRVVDWVLFRRLLQLATEWSFETLRLWCQGDEGCLSRRRSRTRFLLFFAGRLLGRRPQPDEARSWLGTGNEFGSSPGKREGVAA